MGNRLIEKLFVFCCDALAINAAFLLTFWLRYQSGYFPLSLSSAEELSVVQYIFPSIIMTACWLFYYFLMGLYRDWFQESRLDEFMVVCRTILTGIAILFFMISSEQLIGFVATGVLEDIFSHTRVTLLLTYGMCLLFSATLSRFVMHSIYAWLYRKGVAVQNLAVVGASDAGVDLIKEINTYPQLGYRFVGFIDDVSEHTFKEFPILGKVADIPTLVKDKKINSLIISHLTNSARDILAILNYCWDERLTIYMEPSLMDVMSGHLKTNKVCGIPLIVLLQDHMPRWQAQIKRLFDIIISLVILGLFLPLWLLVCLLIKLTDKGPAIYAQERIGQNGKPFIIYKFRSMYINAESCNGPQWATENDPRITPLGRILRKTRIDEIPQMWNVLRGEMSLVGPRPERKHFIDMLSKEIPWYVKRLKMKPGITGWAQVKHKYDETIDDVKKKVMYDLYYFENMSFLLDLKIMIKTIIVVFTGKGAK